MAAVIYKMVLPLVVGFLSWLTLTSSLPVSRSTHLCERPSIVLNDHEIQRLVCLRDSIYDTAQINNQWIRNQSESDQVLFVMFGMEHPPQFDDKCQCYYEPQCVHAKTVALQSYFAQLETMDYPDWMSDSVDLLKNTLPRLQEMVMEHYPCTSENCLGSNFTLELEVGSGLGENVRPHFIFDVIRQLYDNVYSEGVFNTSQLRDAVCKRQWGANLRSCDVRNLTADIDSTTDPLIRNYFNEFGSQAGCFQLVTTHCNYDISSQMYLKRVSDLLDVLQNQTNLPTLVDSDRDILPRLNDTLTIMSIALNEVCNNDVSSGEQIECTIPDTPLATRLETFYAEAEQLSCGPVVEICLSMIVETFDPLYHSMTDDAYFDRCIV